MMNENVYQYIYDELSKYIMPGWDKLVVYLEYGEDSYSFSFYVKNDEKYVKCYDLCNIDEDELYRSFKKIDEFVSIERKKIKDAWTNMTMIIDNNGNVHTDFDYTDLSEGTHHFKKEWKKRYLI